MATAHLKKSFEEAEGWNTEWLHETPFQCSESVMTAKCSRPPAEDGLVCTHKIDAMAIKVVAIKHLSTIQTTNDYLLYDMT